MSTTIVAQIAPQRSTQYAALADALAVQELQISTLGPHLSDVRRLTMGGQDYLQFDLPAELDEAQARELGMLSMTSAFFVYYEGLEGIKGPLLRPLETHFAPAQPPELVIARRYRGKTNEMFTHFMCNVARASSGFAGRPWSILRVFDPLSGGGTTMFTALVLGASAAGVERSTQDAQSTASYLQQFARENRIACKVKHERFRGVGQRWVLDLGRDQAQQCIVSLGDTVDSPRLITGFKPHLIVTDLPYGIQHQGELIDLLTPALPIWVSLLHANGALAMAWESKRFPRSEMIDLVESIAPLTVLNDPPYDALAHRVDRVIKARDLLVARPRQAQA